MSDRDPPEENEGVFKKHALSLWPKGPVQSCPEASRREGRSHLDGRSVRGEYVSTAKGRECRWPACRAYSAEVASATKAGSSGVGTAAFFNTPLKGE
jgi:hypothetical protein